MNFKDRVDAFEKLGLIISNTEQSLVFHKIIKAAIMDNPWFTKSSILYSINSISKLLNASSLIQFIQSYNVSNIKKKIGVIVPSNIPFVGFHDFLCILLSGNTFVGKLSSSNSVLLPYIADLLFEIDADFKNDIFFSKDIDDVDIIIATGSDNSTIYFKHKYLSIPKIIRGNRNSIAILNSSEKAKDYLNLALDVYIYFGLGCRSISKLFLPHLFDLEILRPYFNDVGKSFTQKDYIQNYNYQKSILTINSIDFIDFNNLLLLESNQINSPVSVLYYEYYDSITDLSDRLQLKQDQIQCIVSNNVFFKTAINFGESQQPKIHDFPNQLDVIDFINNN